MRKITSNASKLCMKVNNLNLTFFKLKLTPYILIFFFFFSFFSFSVLQILAISNLLTFGGVLIRQKEVTIEDQENRTNLTVQHDHVVLSFSNRHELELLVFLEHFLIIIIMMIKLGKRKMKNWARSRLMSKFGFALIHKIQILPNITPIIVFQDWRYLSIHIHYISFIYFISRTVSYLLVVFGLN